MTDLMEEIKNRYLEAYRMQKMQLDALYAENKELKERLRRAEDAERTLGEMVFGKEDSK